ncbi:MAG: glycosyltransferase family 2 protein [Candidatus Pseudobacter hemicellulosilyticus]|uniref:Glycosyltransferase family 2 protein n=1 Tax=Candidatus Pseudobacter hemicellulosilyticus TaxID=3121375 RepID=A0AAJ5WU09_9BACT|nr:MAG: glycosyltransferase family 2 protein [Pseudobacter sp.]
MEPISAVIITKNEERNIRRCIHSLKSVADEIIVVDDHSTDNTPAICREEGVKLIQQSWLGFGQQKNVGNDAAAHNYILSMDADEALDPVLTEAIRQAKATGLKGVYQVSRLSSYYGRFIRHGDENPDRKIRLFNRHTVRWGQQRVHETLDMPAGTPVTLLKGWLLHYPYYRFSEHHRKLDSYTSLTALDYFERGKKAPVYKILFSPWWTFMQSYFFKLGLLDGMHGFVLAVMRAHASFSRYVKLWDLHNAAKKTTNDPT